MARRSYDAMPLANASRSAFNRSLWVSVMPCCAPGIRDPRFPLMAFALAIAWQEQSASQATSVAMRDEQRRPRGRSEPQRGADWDHRRASGVDGLDDLAAVDALQLPGRDAEAERWALPELSSLFLRWVGHVTTTPRSFR